MRFCLAKDFHPGLAVLRYPMEPRGAEERGGAGPKGPGASDVAHRFVGWRTESCDRADSDSDFDVARRCSPHKKGQKGVETRGARALQRAYHQDNMKVKLSDSDSDHSSQA
jgi:hypothetical protein